MIVYLRFSNTFIISEQIITVHVVCDEGHDFYTDLTLTQILILNIYNNFYLMIFK